MTEAEWFGCTDPQQMLEFLPNKVSDRKLRLFAVACCRKIWHLLPDKRSREAVEVVERYAEGEATDQERLVALTAADPHSHARFGTKETPQGWPEDPAVAAGFFDAGLAAACAAGSSAEAEASTLNHLLPTQPTFLRCIFGPLPFRPITPDPSWLTKTATSLSMSIYQERAFDRLPILADALEDSGCTNTDILNHCRQQDEHVRGCWVVDLILGKK